MDWHEVSGFLNQLRTLREFLLEVAANEDSLSIIGLRGLQKISGYADAVKVLPNLETNLYACERLANFVDKDVATRIAKINLESPLVGQSAELSIAIKIAEIRKYRIDFTSSFGLIAEPFMQAFGVRRFRKMFEESGEIPIRRMLRDIDRLIPFIDNLQETYYSRLYNDEEVFKPSNINVSEVRVFIDKAAFEISNNTFINSETRSRLDNYLKEANAELAKPAPAWKKIVGALVIISAILGGISVAPEALANINSAVKYILGTSVDGFIPKPDFGPRLLPPTRET